MAAMHSSRLVTNLSLALSLLWAVPAAANPIGDVVGELTTVIGLGKVIGTQGEKPAVRGALVRAGDRIETASGGQRFRFCLGARHGFRAGNIFQLHLIVNGKIELRHIIRSLLNHSR